MRRRPLAPRICPQQAFALPAQERRERETRALYRAICRLRAAGFMVYRAGIDHKVDGRLLATRELFAWARQVKRQWGVA